ncbi:hypothetical protein UlMin_036575 [Ulmus minor]
MNNDSLADFLFKSDAKPTWEERIGIDLNVAKGILYLHEECDTLIIHCDIKPENILMDEQKSTKIADFGLAKLLLPNQTRTITGFRGTRGYADMYSFGIVLLKIICCRRSVYMDVPEDKVVLANWVYDCFLGGEFDQLVEDEEVVNKNDLQRMIKIGLWCILYLYEECDTQIIHCDIKPENILMDEQKCAKIADFRLAKLLMPNQTGTFTGFRGTRGYVAPEWHRNMPITVKADVYSFGIMLIEIIFCRRSVNMDVLEEKVVLVKWVYDCFLDAEVEKNELQRMIKIGLWCIQEEPSLRPSMKKVVLMLEGTIEVPSPPSPTSSSSIVQLD